MDTKSFTESGLDALNQDFRRFDQVDRPQRYRQSESEADEQFDEDF